MGVAAKPLERDFAQRAVEMRELAPGCRVAWRFSDTRSEHLATRRAAGLFDFSFMACVEISGVNSLDLLHASQTRNLATLAVGRIRYTLLLRDDGTVLNDATVWRTGEHTFLVFVGRGTDLQPVVHAAARIDARVDDRSEDFAVLALQGPASREILRRCVDFDPALPYFGFAQTGNRESAAFVARLGYSGEAGYEIVLGAERAPALWEALREAGASAGLEECGFAAANTLRIEAGHILFTNELATPVIPQELRLERLVDIHRDALNPASRLRHKAPTRCLVGLAFDRGELALPAAEGEVMVTSACFSPTLGRWIGLGYVPWASRYPGTRVSVGHARARVARLPFYDPGKRRPREFA